MKQNLSLLLLLALALPLHATVIINKAQPLTPVITQYQKAEWNITLTATYNNPYDQRQVSLDMLLKSPSGKPLLLPCYYDAVQQTWKARFTPQESGTYQYHFHLQAGQEDTSNADQRFTAQASNSQGFLHKHDLWTFQYDNGDLFRGIGENIAWESRDFEADKWTYQYLLPKLAQNGGNFFRTWMCYWNLPLEWKKVHNTKRYSNSDAYFNPGAITRMDSLVAQCDSLHLHFMLTLDWHGHFMQNGGWKNSNYNVANGGPCTTPTDFFTLPAAQEMYKNRLRYIVARWGYSSSIAVWEFFNEVDNAAFTQQDSILIPLPAIAQWHLEMSRYLKGLDPYQHLVSTSISHRDIIGMNSIPYIDFNQKHIYKYTEKIPGIYPDYIQTFGKPYVVGEFGYRWEDQDPKYAVEADYDYKRGLWYGLFSATPLLPMSWWWELFDDQHMMPYLQSVRTISNHMLNAGKGAFTPIPVKAGLLEAYALQCGQTYYVYLLNNTDTTQSPSLQLTVPAGYKLQQFTPSANAFTTQAYTGTAKGMAIRGFALPAKTETVLVFSK
ncbi:protein of unknown function [Chitinophaga costaii]|uniref:DUF5060 domain-containing protein n=1 Tax=Chitinophaga costaii TaxID=1335309 RepID=A0A1C4F0J9_9BACT|nr:DUF5060 domain-containing protein [Chitinophaga costaii]SCC49215.1 protein of unknown function [Chitinophaga costaii]